MQTILEELNTVPGVKGSMVMTADGMVVVEALGPNFEHETVAAMAANMIIRAGRSVEALKLESLHRFVLTAGHGRLVFVNIDIGYLVVIASKSLKLSTTILEIDSAGRRIRTRRVT